MSSHVYRNTSAGEGATGKELRYLATTPETWGAAIDVPLLVPVSPPGTVDKTSTPGA